MNGYTPRLIHRKGKAFLLFPMPKKEPSFNEKCKIVHEGYPSFKEAIREHGLDNGGYVNAVETLYHKLTSQKKVKS